MLKETNEPDPRREKDFLEVGHGKDILVGSTVLFSGKTRIRKASQGEGRVSSRRARNVISMLALRGTT